MRQRCALCRLALFPIYDGQAAGAGPGLARHAVSVKHCSCGQAKGNVRFMLLSRQMMCLAALSLSLASSVLASVSLGLTGQGWR